METDFIKYVGFRISFGRAKCEVTDSMTSSERKVCEHLLFKLDQLKKLSFQQLASFKAEEVEACEFDGKPTTFSIYKEVIGEDKVLVVIQAFYPTWRFPNYFSLNGVGKIFVEAVLINSAGAFEDPSEEILYKYR